MPVENVDDGYWTRPSTHTSLTFGRTSFTLALGLPRGGGHRGQERVPFSEHVYLGLHVLTVLTLISVQNPSLKFTFFS